MKYITYLTLFFSVFFSKPVNSNASSQPNVLPQISPRKKIASLAIKNSTKKITKKFHLQCIGIGSGGERYEKIGLEFYCYKPLTKDEARHMVLSSAAIFGECMQVAQAYFDKTNYLHTKYPAAITIYSLDRNYEHFSDPFVCVASLDKNGIEYLTKGESQKFGYKETIEETLEEAEAKNLEYLEQIKASNSPTS